MVGVFNTCRSLLSANPDFTDSKRPLTRCSQICHVDPKKQHVRFSPRKFSPRQSCFSGFDRFGPSIMRSTAVTSSRRNATLSDSNPVLLQNMVNTLFSASSPSARRCRTPTSYASTKQPPTFRSATSSSCKLTRVPSTYTTHVIAAI